MKSHWSCYLYREVLEFGCVWRFFGLFWGKFKAKGEKDGIKSVGILSLLEKEVKI